MIHILTLTLTFFFSRKISAVIDIAELLKTKPHLNSSANCALYFHVNIIILK